MKLKGLSLNVPVADPRIPLDPRSRHPFVSPSARVGRDYLIGLGAAGPRKLRVPWRPHETVYFGCHGGISLPQDLPDGAPVANVIRRLYVDDGPTVRFDLSIFTHPGHTHPRSPLLPQDYVRQFWTSPVTFRSARLRESLPLYKAIYRLVEKFLQVSTPRTLQPSQLVRPLAPQILVILEADILELASHLNVPLEIIDQSARLAVAVETLSLRAQPEPVLVCYICYPPGHLTERRSRRFEQLRLARALNAWIYTDLSLLNALIDLCVREPSSFPLLSPYFSQLADGFSSLAHAADDRELKLSSLVLPYENQLSQTRAALAKLPTLPTPLRTSISKFLRHCRDEATSRHFQPTSITHNSSAKAKTVFVSYAHEDETHKNRLKAHLSPLLRSKLISEIWDDREIFPGEDWRQPIEKQLGAADLILLLVSPDFFKSDFCYIEEFQKALDRLRLNSAIVLPIVVRPVHWEGTPIEGLQLMPKDGLPITEWPSEDLACVDVVRGIARLLARTAT